MEKHFKPSTYEGFTEEQLEHIQAHFVDRINRKLQEDPANADPYDYMRLGAVTLRLFNLPDFEPKPPDLRIA